MQDNYARVVVYKEIQDQNLFVWYKVADKNEDNNFIVPYKTLTNEEHHAELMGNES
jgi:hypothetical protein